MEFQEFRCGFQLNDSRCDVAMKMMTLKSWDCDLLETINACLGFEAVSESSHVCEITDSR